MSIRYAYDPVGRGIENLGSALQELGRQAGQRRLKEAEFGLLRNKAMFDIGLQKRQEQRAQQEFGLSQQQRQLQLEEQQRLAAEQRRIKEIADSPITVQEILGKAPEGKETELYLNLKEFAKPLGLGIDTRTGRITTSDGKEITGREVAEQLPFLITATKEKIDPKRAKEAREFFAILARPLGSQLGRDALNELKIWEKEEAIREKEQQELGLKREKLSLAAKASAEKERLRAERAIANLVAIEDPISGEKKFLRPMAEYLQLVVSKVGANPIALATAAQDFKDKMQMVIDSGIANTEEDAAARVLEYYTRSFMPQKPPGPAIGQEGGSIYRGRVNKTVRTQ